MAVSDISSRAVNEAGGAKPFLRWAGGKRWLCRVISEHLAITFDRYYEPFLGSGAVFFHLAPSGARLSDVNVELVNAYVQVRDNVDVVIDRLRGLKANKKTYAHFKHQIPTDPILRAVRFIYLNKTAFNGIYRVNREGRFNVPFAGRQGRRILQEAELRRGAKLLQGCEISARDFRTALDEAQAGSLVYCDPPYTVRHNNNGFIRYNESMFSWEQQEALAKLAKKAVSRGVFVAVSNADHSSVRRLYGGFTIRTLRRSSCVAGDPAWRGYASECLIIGDPSRF